MPLILKSTDEVAIHTSVALFGQAPSNALFGSYKSNVAMVGEMAFANNAAAAYANLSAGDFAAMVMDNLGLTAANIGADLRAGLQGVVTSIMADPLYAPMRGYLSLALARLVAGIPSTDTNYGVAATALRAGADAAFTYSSAAGNTNSISIADLTAPVVPSTSFDLTLNKDVASANVFNAPRKLVDGSGYINTLSDDDVLTGTGTNPTLNVEFGAANDITDNAIVQPTLNGITTVNVDWTSNDTTQLNFADANAVTSLNINRVTANNPTVTLSDLAAGTNSLSLADATRGGTVNFQFREDVLQAVDNVLSLALNRVRVQNLNITEGGDTGEDQGYGFETVNITVNGTSNIDNLTIAPNTREDVSSANASQTINLTVNAATEINLLRGTILGGTLGAESINITANAELIVAADERDTLRALNNGIVSNELRNITITGAGPVTIDGLDGHVDTTVINGETGTTLVVDASTHTGGLNLGVEDATASDAQVSTTYATRADEDVRITTGSGNDRVEIYGTLAGDISTGDGNDVVSINDGGDSEATGIDGNQRNNVGETRTDVEGVSAISTGAGNDRVTAANLNATAIDNNQANNGGFDDVQAASIDTGEGDDTVIVSALSSQQDWDNFVLTDTNNDDLYYIKGASVMTGAGVDAVTFTTVAEGAMIDTGADNDTVTSEFTGATILAADSNADETVLNVTAPGGNKEANLAGTAADRLGAIVETGTGDDTVNVTDTTSTATNSGLVIGRDAELRMNAGADTFNVTALDSTNVAANSTADIDGATAGFQSDDNDLVMGVETINLTVGNQVIDDGGASATVNETLNNAAVNDNVETDGALQLDMSRVDGALATVNLISQETVMLRNPAIEDYQAGTTTSFTVDNYRSGVALTLSANEATAIVDGTGAAVIAAPGQAVGALGDDRLLTINGATGQVNLAAAGFSASAADVNLTLNVENGEALDNTVTLRVAGNATDINGGAIDLNVNLNATALNVVTTGDITDRIENANIIFTDGNSHSVNLNSFGDVAFRGVGARPAAVAGDTSSTASSTLQVWSGAAAGKKIDVDAVNADNIIFRNADNSGVIAADVTLRVNAGNNYNIATGSGADVIDLRADDDVRPDDITTAVDRADKVDAGAGRDTLIVRGNDSMGNNNLGTSGAPGDISTVVDDDVFENIRSVEVLTVDVNGGAGAPQKITIDEAAREVTGLDTINIVSSTGAAAAQTVDLVIGNDFTVDNSGNGLAGTLVVDALRHVGALRLNVENKDDDQDTNSVDLELRLTADATSAVQHTVNFNNVGDQNRRVDLKLTTASGTTTLNTRIGDSVALGAALAGNVNIAVDVANLTTQSIDSITLADGANTNGAAGPEANTDTYIISKEWTRDVANFAAGQTVVPFVFDASAVANTDAATDATGATGGSTITVEAGDAAWLDLRGTQNADNITGGTLADTLVGNGGNDTIFGRNGADSISGGDGADNLNGEVGADTISGGAGNDRITGGLNADRLTGDAGNDTFVITVTGDVQGAPATITNESSQSTADTVTDFTTAADKIEINYTTSANTVNFGRFNVVSDLGAGDNSLDGTTTNIISGDAFSTGTQLVVDLDGNGDLTDISDVVVNAGGVQAGDVNYNVNIAGGADKLVRLGQGVDTITSGGGNDTYVVVGSLSSAQVQAYEAAGAGTVAGLTAVVPYVDLLTARGGSEANNGDIVNAGNGNDTLHAFGAVNFGVNSQLNSVETLVIHSDVTLTLAQLYALQTISFVGSMPHSLTIVGNDGSALTAVQQLAALNNVSVVTDGAGAVTIAGGTAVMTQGAIDGLILAQAGLRPADPFVTLTAVDDSAAADRITRTATDIDFNGTSTAGATVTVFIDADNDGVLDMGEASRTVTADVGGNFTTTTGFDLSGDPATGYVARAFVTAANGLRSNEVAYINSTFTVDTVVATPGVTLTADTGASNSDRITSSATPSVSGQEAGASLQYSTDGTNFSGTVPTPVGSLAGTANTIFVRQIDVAGNTSAASSLTYTLDNGATALTAALAVDTGTNGDRISSNGSVNVTGQEAGANVEYSLDGVTFAAIGGLSAATAADAAYTVTVRQTDLAGNVGNTTLAFTKDTAAAAPTVSLQADTGANNADAVTSDAALTVGGEVGATFEYSLNSGATWVAGAVAYNNAIAAAADGAKTVLVRQIDVAGNTSSATTIAFVLDRTIATPTTALTVDSGAAADNITSNASLTNGAIEAGAVVTYVVDGAPASLVYNGAALADGAHTVSITQTDLAGNAATSTTLSFTKDTTVAALTVDLLTDTGTAGDDISSTMTLDVGGTEAGATVEYRLDGGAWGNEATYLLAINAAADGAHTADVRQTDVAGNVSVPTNYAFTKDTSTPIPTLELTADSGSSNSDRISSDAAVTPASAEAGVAYTYSVNGGAFGVYNAAGLADGAYTLVARATDVAGNTRDSATLSFTKDTATATPTVALTSDTGTSNSDRITSNAAVTPTSAEAGVTYTYSVNGGAFGAYNAAGLADGAYTLVARATDVAGNTADSATLSFTKDTTAAVVQTLTSSEVANTATITFDGSVNVVNAGAIELYVNGVKVSVTGIAGSGTNTLVLTTAFDIQLNDNVDIALLSGGLTDAAGNETVVLVGAAPAPFPAI